MKYSRMKYSREWGKGHVAVRRVGGGEIFRRTYSGGSGSVLGNGRLGGGFCLKLVRLLDKTGDVRNMFWQEAKSVSLYTSAARGIPSCVTCPIPAHYWIHENDPIYKKFRCSDAGTLDDFISLFDVKREQLMELGIEPTDYRYIPAELLNNIYQEYELAIKARKYLPDDLFKTIFDNKIKADILLTYPIWKGDISIDKILRSFELVDICKLIYQILSAILALYRNGMAHGDIKPANIMSFRNHTPGRGAVHAEKNYFLTDIGSIHSGAQPSEAGTINFFHTAVYECWEKEIDSKSKQLNSQDDAYRDQNQRFIGEKTDLLCNKVPKAPFETPKELNTLLRRTLMDGYALAATVWAVAWGRNPQTNTLNKRVISDKWSDRQVTDIFSILYDIKNLSITKMQKIADDLRERFVFDSAKVPSFKQLATYGREAEIKFEVLKTDEETVLITGGLGRRTTDADEDSIKIEYGYLTEQFNCSGVNNLMMRCCTKPSLNDFPKDAVIQPLITAYSNGNSFVNNIYYAPDDIETGPRVKDINKYVPYTLDYMLSSDNLDDENIEELLQFANLILIQRLRHEGCYCWLPYPADIVKINGKWMIQPFFLGRIDLHEDFSLSEYFKMLCGRDNALTAQNWADLLYYDKGIGILFNLIPQNMVTEVSELINNKLKETSRTDDSDRLGSFLYNLSKNLKETGKFKKYLN